MPESNKNKVTISKYYFSSRPLMDLLSWEDLQLFKQFLILKKLRKGKELFQESGYPKEIYILKRGKVKIFQKTQNGEEQIVYIYTPGEMFGYRPLLCNQKHPASAKTLEECGVYVLSAKKFLDILAKSTSLSNILLQNLSHEFTVLINRIAAFAQKSTTERVALSLLILREKYRGQNTKPVEITLSRADLAAFAGTTNETLARIISRFKKDKIVKIYGRKIIIHDAKYLFQLATD